MNCLLSIQILAASGNNDFPAWICVVVGGMIVLSIILKMMDKPIRCSRCGYRAMKSRFRGGRCPKCDSLED
jgi:hypothetical protein